MKKLFALVFSGIAVKIIFVNVVFSCTTFCLKSESELLFGRNYDWHIEYGIIFVNKKDVMKSASVRHESSAQWISKYGSVTFNQFGREFPNGGINEAGLVVELMWLEQTEYPPKDNRPEVGGILQWIQYQLDNYSTVEEVIESDKLVRIPEGSVPVHFLITDSKGSCAVIEFLKGRLVSHSGKSLNYCVLTNDTYETSEKYYNHMSDSGKENILNDENNSLNRFAKACSMIDRLKNLNIQPSVDYAFEILNEVSQKESTKWSIVYDINNKKIFYKTHSNQDIKSIDMKSQDFECSKPVMMIDVSAGKSENVNHLMGIYNYTANRKLIEDAYDNVDFLKHIPEDERDIIASYPEKLTCTKKTGMINPENSVSDNLVIILLCSGLIGGVALVIIRHKFK